MTEGLDGNMENLGKVTFKVKLDDECHDFVLEWSEESQCYEGQQLFKQLESITGIPIKYTNQMKIEQGPRTAPARVINVLNNEVEHEKGRTPLYIDYIRWRTCNDLAKEVIRCKNELDCDRFILTFDIFFTFEHFYIYYKLQSSFSIDHTECRRELFFCNFRSTKVLLERMKSIITNDALNARIKDEVSPYPHGRGQHKVFMKFNVAQYTWLPCSSSYGYNSHNYYSHMYLRNRG